MRIVVLNGPNLNMLGKRDVSIYGSNTLKSITEDLEKLSALLNCELSFFQSNSEGEIVTQIQKLVDEPCDGMIINAGAYSHYSIAIRDALELLHFPIVEVHISNIYKRETFRRHSLLSEVVSGQISGLGAEGYCLALRWLCNHD